MLAHSILHRCYQVEPFTSCWVSLSTCKTHLWLNRRQLLGCNEHAYRYASVVSAHKYWYSAGSQRNSHWHARLILTDPDCALNNTRSDWGTRSVALIGMQRKRGDRIYAQSPPRVVGSNRPLTLFGEPEDTVPGTLPLFEGTYL
jgi:hypothetical protein